MEDTGNNNDYPLPDWLRRESSGDGDQDGSQDREDNSTSSVETEAAPAS